MNCYGAENAQWLAVKTAFTRNIIAMVYDFDGTLSPQPMQEYTVLPKLGVKPAAFWREVKEEATQTSAESMLVYMRLLLEKSRAS